MIGGNLPDSDLLVSYGGGKLGYLLQHRGYTHTIVGCVALALLLAAAVALFHRWRGDPLSRREHASMAGFALFAVLLHLGMDALNNYGVHPFWPFDDRWYYGDVLFIVEPSFWIAAAPLVFLQRTLAARIALGAVLCIALVLNVLTHRGQFVEWSCRDRGGFRPARAGSQGDASCRGSHRRCVQRRPRAAVRDRQRARHARRRGLRGHAFRR